MLIYTYGMICVCGVVVLEFCCRSGGIISKLETVDMIFFVMHYSDSHSMMSKF